MVLIQIVVGELVGVVGGVDFHFDHEAPIVIRALRQRWGSTTKAGRVYFNVDLVKLPLPCIDYVVAHELVHLMIPNHSPAFWRMLGRVMPDWQRWRDRLKRVEF